MRALVITCTLLLAVALVTAEEDENEIDAKGTAMINYKDRENGAKGGNSAPNSGANTKRGCDAVSDHLSCHLLCSHLSIRIGIFIYNNLVSVTLVCMYV